MNFQSLILSTFLFNLFAYISIKLRPKIFSVDLFKPMIWNIKLSIMPILILLGGFSISLFLVYLSTLLNITVLNIIALIVFVLTLLVWILFLPNSAYLLTELNLTHRDVDKNEVPIWYDIISVLSLSLSGIFNTLMGIVLLQITYLIIFDPQYLNTINQVVLLTSAILIIVLVSIGIYLGRELRFNSWDVLHPLQFIKKLNVHFQNKEHRRNFFLFIIFHSIFFLIMYLALGIPKYFIS